MEFDLTSPLVTGRFNPMFRLTSFLPILLCLSVASAQVVINEIQVVPPTSSLSAQFQSMFNCPNPTFGAEWVELYNPDPCNPVDISGFILGSRTASTNFGAIMFPAGTVIPPLGFYTAGGALSGANLNMQTLCSTSNICVDGDARWFLENGDGWIGLYNATGASVDAVYWTFAAGEAGKISTDPEYTGSPCIPSGSAAPSLLAANAIVGIEYAGGGPSMGTSLIRTTDGGATWGQDPTPTLGACNATCSSITCPLPVFQQEFAGYVTNGKANLKWQVSSDLPSVRWELQWSDDALNYATFSDGTWNAGTHSGAVQIPMISSTKYFRILVTDPDGRRTVAGSILMLQSDSHSSDKLSVFPNPAGMYNFIRLVSDADQEITVLVNDMAGKEIWSGSYQVYTGVNTLPLNGLHLSPGMYIIGQIGAVAVPFVVVEGF